MVDDVTASESSTPFALLALMMVEVKHIGPHIIAPLMPEIKLLFIPHVYEFPQLAEAVFTDCHIQAPPEYTESRPAGFGLPAFAFLDGTRITRKQASFFPPFSQLSNGHISKFFCNGGNDGIDFSVCRALGCMQSKRGPRNGMAPLPEN